MAKSIFEKNFEAIQNLFHQLNDSGKLNTEEITAFNNANKKIVNWYSINFKHQIDTIQYPEHFNNDVFKKSFNDFILYRSQRKKPINTSVGIKKIINKLSEISGNCSETAIKILDRTIENTWTGLFPLSKDKKEIIATEKDSSYESNI